MTLRFPGTGYGPNNCKKRLTKEFRRAASLLIDDTLLIDPTEDTFDFESSFSLGGLFANVTDVLVTSSEPCSFSRDALARLAERHQVNLFASPAVAAKADGIPNVRIIPLHPFSVADVGSYRVVALPASHTTIDPAEISYLYAIGRDKALLYAPTGALLPKESFRILKNLKFSAVILGAPLGDAPTDERVFDLLSYDGAKTTRDLLLSAKIITPDTPFFLTALPFFKKREYHAEASARASEDGMMVTYDGYYTRL